MMLMVAVGDAAWDVRRRCLWVWRSKGQYEDMIVSWLGSTHSHTTTHTWWHWVCMCVSFWHNRKCSEQKRERESERERIPPFPLRRKGLAFCPLWWWWWWCEDSQGNSCMWMKLEKRSDSDGMISCCFPSLKQFLWAEPPLHLYTLTCLTHTLQ